MPDILTNAPGPDETPKKPIQATDGPTFRDLELSLPARQSARQEILQLVGQDAALLAVRAALRRYGVAQANAAWPVALIGPNGVGKTLTAQLACREAGIPLVEIDLGPIMNREALLDAITRGLLPHITTGNGKAAVLFENIAGAGLPLQWEIAQLLRKPPVCRVAQEGRPFDINLATLQYFVALTGSAGPEGFFADTSLIPELEQALKIVVPFAPLKRVDLYTLLSLSPESPITGLQQRLEAAGVAFELTEGALWDLATAAYTRFPHAGARALEQVVGELEWRIWQATETLENNK
jgi:hypothetical protein